jgi:hypothetical protein
MKLKAPMSRYKYKLKETSTISSTSGFTSGTTGENIASPRAFKKSTKGNYGAYTQVGFKPVKEGPGTNMGPGPKAGPKGITDNTYVKKFKYRLVDRSALNKAAKGIEVKQLWETTDVDDYLKSLNVNDINLYNHIKERIEGFNTLEEKINILIPLLAKAKQKTLEYYRNNPTSYGVVYGTDMAIEYLNDLIDLFSNKPEESGESEQQQSQNT